MKTDTFIKIITYTVLSALIALNMVSCAVNEIPGITDDETGTPVTTVSENNDNIPVVKPVSTANLMEQITAGNTEIMTADWDFILNSTNFAFEMFRRSVSIDKNSMISPLSVLLALSMTANGADGDTLAQMEEILGGNLNIDVLNKYLRGYTDSLTSTEKAKLSIANSIWFRDDENSIQVNPDFLQKNADYFNADAYKAAFDDNTITDINNWVNNNTDGLIDSILTEIPGDAVMYLINAMVFDAAWEYVYNIDQVFDGTFYANDGTEQTVSMMRSEENKYLDDGNAAGFIKPYADGQYSFIALLPNENVSIQDYIASLTAEGFLDIIESAQNGIVNATLPKFSSEYKIEMNDVLKDVGITDAFDASIADFTRLGHSAWGNMYISNVIHKTYISVDELGTKAGAVTSVEVSAESAIEADYYTVILDRPFVYAIVDNNTNLPLFIGCVLNIQN
ncbi:MAG: serpin family protein [Eubacteriales bacterium]